ncbi:MAG: hypothetical protein K2W96_19450 [Gemmataceae bacterium]|nr:hypothetical protein [Gemmataceae bacterium]
MNRAELLLLLQAARESPDDPLALLVVADWLEENGDGADRDRAEAIRLFARSIQPLRQAEIAARHRARWLRPFLECEADPRLVGGTVHANLSAKALLAAEELGAHLREEWAWLFHAALACSPADAPKAAASAVLATVPALRLALADKALAAVLASPHLGGLRSLSLKHNRMGEEGARIVAQAPLRGLRALVLSDNDFGDRGMAHLLASPCLGNVETLDLAKTALRNGVADLARSPAFPRLCVLDLGRNSVGRDGAKALAVAAFADRLRVLRLESCGLTDQAVGLLAGSEGLRNLRELHLGGNALTDASAASLAEAPWPRLERVDLAKTKCTAKAVGLLEKVKLVTV